LFGRVVWRCNYRDEDNDVESRLHGHDDGVRHVSVAPHDDEVTAQVRIEIVSRRI
jgi:hypothetical protein